MSNILIILAIGFMLATLGVLVLGIINFARGGRDPEASSERSNKLMMLRVMFQGAAILLLFALFMLGR